MDGCKFSSQDSIIFFMACGVHEEFCVGLWVYDCRPQCGGGVHLGAVGVNPGVGVPSRGPWRWDGRVGCRRQSLVLGSRWESIQGRGGLGEGSGGTGCEGPRCILGEGEGG